MKNRRIYETTEFTGESSVFSKRFPLKEINKRIISGAFEVHSKLGSGLLERSMSKRRLMTLHWGERDPVKRWNKEVNHLEGTEGRE